MPRAKLLIALSVVFLLGASLPYLARTAEEKPRELPALKVAYLDMGKLFQNCTSYKNAIEKMKAQTTELEGNLKAEYEDMRKLADQLKYYSRESDDYKRLKLELEGKETAFKLRQANLRKEFETRINEVQFKLYQDIERFSRAVCDKYGVGILLRHNTSIPDGKDPQQVLRTINNTLIVADPRLDLTDEVLIELNKLPPVEVSDLGK